VSPKKGSLTAVWHAGIILTHPLQLHSGHYTSSSRWGWVFW